MTRFDNLARIRALLRKTTENGCTEAEAFAALTLANDLIMKYDIPREEVEEIREEGAVVEGQTRYDPMNVRSAIGPAIARFTSTQVWELREGGSRSRRQMKFCGEKSDVQLAHWLLDSLYGFVCREMGRYVIEHRDARNASNGFYLGATRRIAERLDELTAKRMQAAGGGSRALVVVKDAIIAAKMEELGIKIQTRTKTIWTNRSAEAAGREAGDRASFGRPITGEAGVLRIGQN